MKGRKIFGTALIVIGALMVMGSHYIADQVAQGKIKIYRAQQQVDTANTLFNQSEYTKPVGGMITGGAQRKINEGKAQVTEYESLAQSLQIVGVICIAAGVGVLFIKRRRS
jgi:uncharacterized protein YjeT (DUF2065 family)